MYLKRSFAVENELLTDDTEVLEGIMQGVNQQAKIQQFSIESFKIGPYEMENVLINVPNEGEGARIGRHEEEITTHTRVKSHTAQTKGVLGYDVLKHFVLTIDYKYYRAHIYAP